MKEIEKYRYAWDHTSKVGHLQLLFKGVNQWSKWTVIENVEEFLILTAMLRHEKPVYWSINSGHVFFQTEVEPVGESEQ